MTAEHSPTPEELMAYLDGERPGDSSHGVAAHLATCERCQHLADDLRGVSRDLRAWRVDDAPDALHLPDGVAVAVPPAPSRVWRLVRTRSFAAAAAVVMVVAAVIAWNARPRRQPASGLSVAERMATELMSSPGATANRSASVLAGGGGGGRAAAQTMGPPAARAPLVERTTTLRMVASDFTAVRPAIDRTLRAVGGFIGQLGASDSGTAPRSIHATLRVPAARLDEAVAAFKTLGRVSHESHNAEDVTEQVVDLDARIANARITEERLIELIQTRTGRVSDVLEAEREIARVRTELERLDAQRKNVQRRVEYAIVVLDVVEEARASVTLGPQPVSARLRHGAADGVSSALSSLLGATLFVLRAGPVIVVWTTLVGLPAWWLVRRRYAIR